MFERYWQAFKNVLVFIIISASVLAVSLSLKKPQPAIKNISKNSPEAHQTYLHNGTEMIKQEQYDKGIEWYEKAIETDPDDGLSYFCLANAYRLKNEPGYAVDYYKKAISLRPEHSLSYYHLGLSYKLMGNKEKAWKVYDVLKEKDGQLAERLKNNIRI